MGHRLSKIYTRTGDKGETGLGDGSRIAKDDIRMDVIGSCDELNSHIGLVLTEVDQNHPCFDMLIEIQHDLLDLGGEICIPGYVLIKQERINWMENMLDELNEPLPPLTNFILPGGNKASAYCHLARTVCRRAERLHVGLSHQADDINPLGGIFLNRLSDLLFVTARTLARVDGDDEVLWRRPR